ncbi:MAG TPA: transposase [Longimicrobiales bacterium]
MKQRTWHPLFQTAQPAMGSPRSGDYPHVMGRTRRLNATGVPFHLTARVQGHDPLFVGIEQRMTEHILHYSARARMQLIAWALMPNHLHIVAVQGDLPLWRFMQPLLRRIALLVKVRAGREGHVFERRYGSRPALDAEYLRTVIAYVHLNPVRAGMCDSPDEFAHSSHGLYRTSLEQRVPSPLEAAIELTLRLFAVRINDSPSACRANYLRFLRWRLAADAHLAACNAEAGRFGPRPPVFPAGDAYWSAHYRRPSETLAGQTLRRASGADLRTIALRTLDDTVPGLPLDWLRSGGQTRLLARTRRQVIARCLAAGYANHQIAAFLNVSGATVSKVAAMQPLPVLVG